MARGRRASGAGRRRRARAVGVRALPHRGLAAASACAAAGAPARSCPEDRDLVLVCHHGSRSQQAAMWLAQQRLPPRAQPARAASTRGRSRSTPRCRATEVRSEVRIYIDCHIDRATPSRIDGSGLPHEITAISPRPACASCLPLALAAAFAAGAAAAEDLLQIYREAQKQRPADRRRARRSGKPRRSGCRRRARACCPACRRSGAANANNYDFQPARRETIRSRPQLRITSPA